MHVPSCCLRKVDAVCRESLDGCVVAVFEGRE